MVLGFFFIRVGFDGLCDGPTDKVTYIVALHQTKLARIHGNLSRGRVGRGTGQ